MLRFAGVWTLTTLVYVVAVIAETVDQVLLAITLVSAALAGVGVIWKKGIVPMAVFFRRLSRAVDALFDLRDWQRSTDGWRERVEYRLDAIEHHLEADVTIRHTLGPGTAPVDRPEEP